MCFCLCACVWGCGSFGGSYFSMCLWSISPWPRLGRAAWLKSFLAVASAILPAALSPLWFMHNLTTTGRRSTLPRSGTQVHFTAEVWKREDCRRERRRRGEQFLLINNSPDFKPRFCIYGGTKALLSHMSACFSFHLSVGVNNLCLPEKSVPKLFLAHGRCSFCFHLGSNHRRLPYLGTYGGSGAAAHTA